jgi:hypothetical protein
LISIKLEFILFWDIPVSADCFANVQLTLESPGVQPFRRVKWAQGITGNVTLSIPLPTSPSVPSVLVLPAPAPTVVVINALVPFASVPVTAPTDVVPGVSASEPIPSPSVVVLVVSAPVSTIVVTNASTPTAAMPVSVPIVPLSMQASTPGSFADRVQVAAAVPVRIQQGTISVAIQVQVAAPRSVPFSAPVSPSSRSFRFYLLNANTDRDIAPISSNQVLSFATIGTTSFCLFVLMHRRIQNQWCFTWNEDNGTTKSTTEKNDPWCMGGNIGSNVLIVPYFIECG